MKFALVCLMALIGFAAAKEDLLNELDKELLFDVLQENKLDEKNDPNFCAGKANGDYADPADCTKYITCSNNIASTDRNCPGGLHFNPKTSACDYPTNVDCKSKGKGDCSGKADGNYADPKNCYGFIMCSNGISYSMNCPSGLKFDKSAKKCDYPSNVVCSANDDVEYDASAGRKAAPSKDPFCKNKKNGNYVNPYECEGFIMCSNHLTYFFDCPSILQYNPKTDRCDWPENVNCGSTPSPTTKPTRPPVTPSSSRFCKRRPNGNYVDPNNCNGFIMCSNHLTYFFNCPANLRYNAKTDQCDWPENVKCGPTPSPTATRPTRPPITPSPSNFCKKRPNGNYVDPNNCNGFIMCSNHLTYFFDCPANLRYNAKTDRCDWPWNVKCGPTPSPTATRPTRPPVTPSPSKFCKRRPNGNYVDPNNCNGFIMCSNHLTYFFDCPANLRYNAKTDRCDWPWNVKCGPTQSPTTRPTRPTPSSSTFCKRRPNGNYVDPNNCNGFIMCSNHLTYFFDCPANLRYNAKTDQCDWPWNVKCGPTPSPTTRPTRPTPSPSNFCKRRPNGNYVDPNNCNGFIMCSNHLTYFFDCPANLRYNAKTDRCDWPWNVQCGPTPRPTTKRPTRPPITPSSSKFCKGRPNGNYVDPNNCNGFISCSNHLTYFMDCPANLRYNAETDRCDWPRNVICPTPMTLGDALQISHRERNPFCVLHGDGDYRDITNCEGYFTCYRGYQIFRECPGTQRFNPATRKCDLPRNVKCAGAGGGQRGSRFCKKRKNGDYRDVLNCNGFIKCSNSYTYYFDCPSILRFNARTDRCDWPRNVRCRY